MREITTSNAPRGSGPFSQAIVEGGRIYVAGQGGVDPKNGEVVSGGITPETEQTLENIEQILQVVGADLNDVIKINAYLADIDNYEPLNKAYSNYFEPPYPARSVVEVSSLPIDIQVEIEAVARLPD